MPNLSSGLHDEPAKRAAILIRRGVRGPGAMPPSTVRRREADPGKRASGGIKKSQKLRRHMSIAPMSNKRLFERFRPQRRRYPEAEMAGNCNVWVWWRRECMRGTRPWSLVTPCPGVVASSTYCCLGRAVVLDDPRKRSPPASTRGKTPPVLQNELH